MKSTLMTMLMLACAVALSSGRGQAQVNPTAATKAAKSARTASSAQTPAKRSEAQRSAKPKTPGAAQEAASEAAPKLSSNEGKRDPFVNPVARVQAEMGTGKACGFGKRCIDVRQVQVRGIVQNGSTMVAVVETTGKRTYFLHENDPVLNGYVLKITGDSVIFRETVMDRNGRITPHDTVKKMAGSGSEIVAGAE